MTTLHRALTLFLAVFLHSQLAAAYGYLGINLSDRVTSKPSLNFGFAGEEWGGGMFAIFNSEFTKDDIFGDGIPHTSYVDVGEKRLGNALGFDVNRIFYSEYLPQDFYAYLGASLSFQTHVKLVRSTATGFYWNQGERSEVQVGATLGIQVRPSVHKIGSFAEFSTLRGFGFGILYGF